MPENLERNEGVVLRLHYQRRYADSLQKLVRRLGFIVVLGAAKSEGRRRDLVVDLEDGANTLKVRFRVAPRRDQAVAHAAQESALVQAVVDPAQPPGACRQIDGRGNRASSPNQTPGALTQLARQLQCHIAAQREPRQIHRSAPLLL